MRVLLIFLIAFNVNALEEFDCMIVPEEEMELSSPVNGILESVLVDFGNKIKKGQVLVKLESKIEKANVKLAKIRADSTADINEKKARHRLNQQNKARVEKLFKNKAVSQKELDEARAITVVSKYALENSKMEHQLAQQELKRNQEILAQRSIVSPFDGVVQEKFKSAGEFVDNQQSAILKLAKTDMLHIEVFLPFNLYGTVKKGMQAKIISEESTDTEYTAKVHEIAKTIQSDSGLFQVRLHLPNKNRKIISGVRCKIEFIED